MPQQIIISEQLRIAALLNDERIDELIVAQGRYQIGDIFLGMIENVLPGIDAAFVNIGESEKNGFIHVNDLGPLRLKKGASGITELLEPRQKVLVQVMKEPTGNKGPRLTGNLSLPGRYLVLQPHGQGVNISRRINAESERNRLRALGVLVKPPSTGLLMRTEANGIKEELLIEDLENLLKQWDLIQQASESCTPPILLNRDEDFIHRILRDHVGSNQIRIVVEDSSAVERVKEFLGTEREDITIESHTGNNDLLEHYKVNAAIHNALKPRVDLPSGGYIIIEPTEALTVIDVNSGSFTRSSNSRETVLWTNCEAAIEIARQLKLRNIGGVIIIDFIDMDSRRDQLQLLEHFTDAIKDDLSRPQIAQLTELGLVELTRKRQGQNIYELFGQTCPHCAGKGQLAILPEKEKMQPLATASGYIPTGSSIKKELQFSAENEITKKKKSNRGKEIEPHINSENNEVTIHNEVEINNEDSNYEQSANKKEAEIIGVKMNEEEEYVFSSLGLNPILLLENIPKHENIVVNVLRPGVNEEEILQETRQKLASNSSKKRRRGAKQYTSGLTKIETEANQSPITIDLEISTQEENKNEVITDSPVAEDPKKSQTIIDDSLPPEIGSSSTEASQPGEEEIEDPRRRRRRSSAV